MWEPELGVIDHVGSKPVFDPVVVVSVVAAVAAAVVVISVAGSVYV